MVFCLGLSLTCPLEEPTLFLSIYYGISSKWCLGINDKDIYWHTLLVLN